MKCDKTASSRTTFYSFMFLTGKSNITKTLLKCQHAYFCYLNYVLILTPKPRPFPKHNQKVVLPKPKVVLFHFHNVVGAVWPI